MKENDHYIVKEDVVIAEEHPELPEADIQEIVNNFNIEEHEVPVTIGHNPKDSDPAYGWIKSVKKVGNERCQAK